MGKDRIPGLAAQVMVYGEKKEVNQIVIFRSVLISNIISHYQNQSIDFVAENTVLILKLKWR